MSAMRPDGRAKDELRPVVITPDYITYPEGSVLIEVGQTKVICNVSVEERVPHWLVGQNQGWVTAEYGMLPRSTHTRTPRETRGPRARTQEIRRLIGRSLRAAVDLTKLGERTLTVDCDVIQADGGTRTASITGAYVAMHMALRQAVERELIESVPLVDQVAAVSCGLYQGNAVLDLDYLEDSAAEADTNFVLTGAQGIVEIQGTAEDYPFSEDQFMDLMGLAKKGVGELVELQREVLELE